MAEEIKWTTVHPIPWRNTSFTWVPYWIFDIIAASDDWREYTGVYQDIFDTLKQAYEDYGDVDFIESRNGYIHKLSTYTPADPTITPKTKPSSFKVGDPDLDVATLFTVVPSDTAVTLTTADATKASIVSGKVHAVAVGDVVITATAGSVTSTLTITVSAAA